MRVWIIFAALLASAVASHLHAAHMQWQAVQQDQAEEESMSHEQYVKPSDVPKSAEQEKLENAENQGVTMKSMHKDCIMIIMVYRYSK